jgi:universal bacterial protein YeaZ
MNILSLDTATTTLHLGLKGENFYEERLIKDSLQHSDEMLSIIKALLASHNLGLKDLNLLIATRGPGAFTSLRIGMATLKGFSLALDIPVVTVPTLDALAETVAFADIPVITAIDAKKRRYYLAVYRNGKAEIEAMDGNAEDLIDYVNKEDKVLVTGPDAAAFAAKLIALEPRAKVLVDGESERNTSSALIRLGLEAFETRGADDIGQGPVYIRRSDAEEALIAKQKGESK